MRRLTRILQTLVLALALGACSDLTRSEVPAGGTVVALNSVGQSIVQFEVNGGVERVGSEVALPEQADGDAIDILGALYVVSVSSFGGSQLVVGDLDTGDREVIVFPDPDATEVNPSKPTFGRDDIGRAEVWVAGRGDGGIYRVRPGQEDVATRMAEDVGRWVERVIPLTETLVAAIDANLDESFQPAGPARVLLVNPLSGEQTAEISLEGAFNATDVLTAEGLLVVLAGGTFRSENGSFVPEGNGAVVLVNVNQESVIATLPLEGNGISIRPGRDGRAYVVRTSDFETTDVLSLDPFGGAWVRGPDDPIQPRTADDAPLSCWTATALRDGRLVCATFRVEQAGRLHLLGEDGRSTADAPSGFGTTDLVFRR